ncbi:hypothetical protein KUTeg_008377 [Tegillarca granosa]|uniref:EF-hand domain-containing protein n=1 Tax=Tegillarca granosa TaxID=220873 RepID=A0ABQ9FB62_TEGGR|nr:hypothetical protein KUTeg_008377 [Tegillarca granosa]
MALAEKEEKWKNIFNQLDTDGSGFINMRELKQIMQTEGQELCETFMALDDDSDQKITLKEFLEEMCKPTLEEQFKKADADNTGFLEEDEFRNMLAALGKDEETIQKCLTLCDRDGDGKINYKELHKVLYQE